MMGAEVQKVKVPFATAGKTIEVREYDCTYVGDYFAVLKNAHWNGQDERWWQVTHRPSGFRGGKPFPTKAKAMEFALKLERRAKRLGIGLRFRSKRGMDRVGKTDQWKNLCKYTKKLRAELNARSV